MKKESYIYMFLFSFFVLLSCSKDVVIERNPEGALSDIYANIEDSGPSRMFEPRYSNDTIYFDIPYYYPLDSDFETDLTKIIVRATISSDAMVSAEFGKPMDLTKPFNFSVVSGTGVAKEYVIVTRKVGDTSIPEALITYEQDDVVQEVDAIFVEDEIRFFVEPGVDMSNTTLTFTINKHATSSIASGSVIDLNTEKNITVSAPGDAYRTYKIVLMEPIKLPYGFGIHRRLWWKEGADFGFTRTGTASDESSIAVSGDYLIITQNRASGNSQYKVFDRFTGEYIRDMYIPFTASSGALSRSDQLVADEKGHLLAMNRVGSGQALYIYKYNDPFDEDPTLLINITPNSSTGRRLNVIGDVTGNAIITSPVTSTESFLRWEIKGGEIVSQTPMLITIDDGRTNSHGIFPEIQYINASVNSNYLLAYQQNFSYVNGNTNNQINSISIQGGRFFTNALAIGRFNNATYAFLGKYPYNLSRVILSMFDITNPQMIGLESSSSQYSSFNVFNSEILDSTPLIDSGGKGDIAVGYSHDGERMQVYMLHSGNGVLAHEFTAYSPN